MKIDTQIMKQLNVLKVRKAFVYNEILTKNDLAKITGLSTGTVGTILKEMLVSDEIMEIDNKSSSGGRPSRQFIYNNHSSYILTIFLRAEDLEETINAAVYDLKGNLISEMIFKLNGECLSLLLSIITDYTKKYKQISSISIGVPGVVSHGTIGICDFKELEKLNIYSEVLKIFNGKIIIENDVNASAIGSSHINRNDNLVYIYFPNNGYPGAGILIDGKIHRGVNNYAGEVSFLPFTTNYSDTKSNPSIFFDSIFNIIQCINYIINPDLIVISGLSVSDDIFRKLDNKNKLSKLLYEKDFKHSYQIGLKKLAIDNLLNIISIMEE